MSFHVPTNPEINARLAAQKRNVTITSFIIALLICALLVGILWMISLSSLFKNTEELVTYSTQSESEEKITKPEMTDQVQKKPSSPSSSMSKVITSSTPSATAVPVPDITVTEPSLDFGSGDDFGDGWGNGSGNGAAGGGKNTPFGRSGGSGMQGSFYDLKQTDKKSDTKLGKFYKESGNGRGRIEVYKSEIRSLARGKYSLTRLAKYYKANLELTFTHVVMGNSKAHIAPAAFGVEKEVEPSGLLIIYEGKLAADAPNDIKFTGRYDDLLVVYVNNKVVFDGSWSDHTGDFDKGEDVPGATMFNKVKMRRNKKFISLRKGDDIRIVIGESPGGYVGGGLFVEEEGVKYKKNKDGQNILPPFCAEPLDSSDIKKLKKINYPMELNDVPVFKIN